MLANKLNTDKSCAGERELKHAFFQPKLTINQPNDVYEQEADHMADKVMRMTDFSANQHAFFKPANNMAQRKCQACEEEKHVHRKESGTGEVQGSNELDNYISSLSSSGQPMPEDSRKFFEPKFGHDFSGVKLHTDAVAANSARSINALAYTSGNNIVFNTGQYSPHSDSGKKLIAHELTHVVQQKNTPLNQTISRVAIDTGRILNEGSCEHLACNSRFACDDPAGVLCPDGTLHAGHKKKPLFTCDVDCEHGGPCGTNYMAIPHSRWRSIAHNCGQDLVVCANHSFVHANLRDRSNREAWELSPSLISALGGGSGDITNGAIYPDEHDHDFLSDTRCRPAAPHH